MIADQPYTRQLVAPVAADHRLAFLEADPALLGHAGPELSSLRVTRPDGSVVPYRVRPRVPASASVNGTRLNGGTTATGAVAEFDLGSARMQRQLDMELRLRAGVPLGRVRISGSSDRRTWARFARGFVYRIDEGGSVPAYSTRIVYPPVDYRYLRVEISGAASIDAAVATLAASARSEPAQVALPALRSSTTSTAASTIVTLRLLGHPVVSRLRIETSAARLDRPFVVEQPSYGGGWVAVASGELRRTRPGAPLELRGLASDGSALAGAFVSDGGRLRVRIVDGGDPPLPGLRVRAYAEARTLVLDRPGPGPLTLRYGARLSPASYEFARLPLAGAGAVATWRLGPEIRLATPEPARSLWQRHGWLGSALFVGLTAIVALAGIIVIRQPRPVTEPSA